MSSPRRLFVNRLNARRSTGPKTAAGKAVSARNALRHGLNVPVMHDPALAPEVARLARAIAGADASPRILGLASAVAEAQVDLQRARRARHEAMSRLCGGDEDGAALLVRLERLDRYERDALSRRKFAVRAYDAARLCPGGAAGAAGRAFFQNEPNEGI